MLKLSPSIAFSGEAREALEFNQGIFGGALQFWTHADFGNTDPDVKDTLAHGQLDTESFTLMAGDVPDGKAKQGEGNTTILIFGEDYDTGKEWFEKLAEGGTLTTEFKVHEWGDAYGDLVDRFGVVWGVNVSPKPEAQ